MAPLKFLSIASSVIVALGILCVTGPPASFYICSTVYRPQYWEIYKRKEVIGLSITFMAVDIGGGVFSILSLAFKEKFDVFASIVYVVVIASRLLFSSLVRVLSSIFRSQVTDLVVVIAALVLNPIARRKRAAQASKPVPMVKAPIILISGAEGSNSPKKSDLVSSDRPAVGEIWLDLVASAKT